MGGANEAAKPQRAWRWVYMHMHMHRKFPEAVCGQWLATASLFKTTQEVGV